MTAILAEHKTKNGKDFHYYMEDSEAFENLKAGFQQVNWGIYIGSVIPEWCENQLIPITELFMRNIQSKTLLMFQTVFIVLFIGEETRSSFMKNLNAAFPDKLQSVVGKIAVAGVFCAMLYILSFLAMLASFYICEGYAEMTAAAAFIKYALTEYILYIAYSLVIMLLCYLIRNSAVCLLIGLLEAAGILQIVDSFIASGTFSTMNYLVSGNIVLLSIDSSSAEYFRAIAAALVFAVLSVLGITGILQKGEVR